MRVALVHDWLTGVRGGERVLDALARLYPDAEIHTLLHVPGSVTPLLESRRIHTSPLDALPGRARHYRKLLPLYPWAVRRLELPSVDLVVSSSHAVAKSVRVPTGAVHVCYCHTPMRYAWDQVEAYLGTGLLRTSAGPLIRILRAFDVRYSGPDHVHRFLANSTTVARRIFEAYGREARVLPPPVNIDRFVPHAGPPENFFLVVTSFAPYKADALVLEAFRRSGRPLVFVGDGPGRARLEKIAPANVRFLGRVDDEELAQRLARCRALIHAQCEDFGIAAVEAQASGRPVIAYGRGGVLDSVVPLAGQGGVEVQVAPPTGLFFAEQTPDALVEAVDEFERVESRFEPEALRRHAERFSEERFMEDFLHEIDQLMKAASQSEAGDLLSPGSPSSVETPR